MQTVLRMSLLAATALAFGMGAVSAQTDDGAAGAETATESPLPPDAAPKPMSPAETETPQRPAAAGGAASDATESGAPLGSAPAEATAGSSETGDANDTSEPAAASSEGSPENPRNAVGDQFELPRVSEENQVELIAGLCGVQMKTMSPLACQCLAEQTLTGLSDPQRDYLIATAVAPPVAERMLNDGRVGTADQRTIFTFLNSTSDACATGRYVAPDSAEDDGEAPGAMPDEGDASSGDGQGAN
ncbi:hypothetical protein [Jiella marina]|uniref:hypothetical protein n=1 Tax=Jiella sp. LLJ827 TaxID=2917712 RepID=UPI002101B6A6|nr:hypothetical protein [Jiella sp. LLJ827]MCQ0988411.1 hypothetical protein [Jiella sp. LLJ827]